MARIIFACVCMSVNQLIAEAEYRNVYRGNKDDKTERILPYIFNMDVCAGAFIVIIGLISLTDRYKGKRITLIVLCIIFATVWNIIWMSFSDISEVEI